MSDASVLTWSVPADASPGRLDKALAAVWTEVSRTLIQRALEAGEIRVGGQVVAASHRLRGGEVVEWRRSAPRRSELRPVAIPLEILHEDAHLLVVNKRAGMVVHPGAGTGEDTLVHALLAHCAGSLSGIGGVERPGIVHRLDRETSGAIVIAKGDQVHAKLARSFQDRSVRKEYGVLVQGDPKSESGEMRGAIARHGTRRHRMAVVRTGGREALTEWRVIERFGGSYAWLSCRIRTGRTHQIRVHCQAERMPVLGDPTYGWNGDRDLPVPPGRVMLHARLLEFRHPATGKPLKVEAPWPADFQEQVAQLRAVFSFKGASA